MNILSEGRSGMKTRMVESASFLYRLHDNGWWCMNIPGFSTDSYGHNLFSFTDWNFKLLLQEEVVVQVYNLEEKW